ncbi:hypothetical protein [Endozoicomonas sp. YOMI1]|uniref:hypothetical protein n=1 Tax=Endozoicomonas sp. YOMI1 TaxID=2828739 RepID=UPI0021483971|nr:hypothetical protein [Endozoicomonas sp. YOMI1]
MNASNAIIDRFASFFDYLRSSAFKENPTANIFSPLRKVSSEPAINNYLPLTHELKFEITKYLNLKDFIAFSSINVDNYLSLRSDDLLVKRVIKNEPLVRMLERLKDLNEKSQQYLFDITEEIELDENYEADIPPMAISPGPARLFLNSNPEGYRTLSVYFVKLFQYLCMFANDDSTDLFFRAHICSLTIDINNRMSLKGGENAVNATSLALYFIDIASQVNQLIGIEEKDQKLHTLANMIENNELKKGKLSQVYYYKSVLREKNEFDWDNFIDNLLLKNDNANVPRC